MALCLNTDVCDLVHTQAQGGTHSVSLEGRGNHGVEKTRKATESRENSMTKTGLTHSGTDK